MRDNSTRFKSWGLKVRVSRTVLRRASNRTYCNCRARLSNDDCTMARTSIRWQITIKNCVLGAYHGSWQAGCVQSIHMPELPSAFYQVVKVEAGPETDNREIACRACGSPLTGRDGKFVLKYFLLRKAIPSRRRA